MRAAFAFILILALTAIGRAADVEGSADHQLLPRYEGSEIVRYQHDAYADFRLMVAPATAYGGLANNLEATLPLEGTVTRISYRAPAERSVLEVFRNYERALADAGFETIFACDREACGGRNFNHAVGSGELYGLFGEYQAEQRYLAGKLTRPEGDVYVALYVVLNRAGGGPNRDRAMIQLDLVELAPMEERMVVLDAAALGAGLSAEGRIAVYGILFDFDRADIRPESEPQLEEIAAMLAGKGDLQVLVVGHTDGQGGLDYNLALSQRRAGAVVDALAARGIAASRMTAVGVGMAAPVASNRTEEGRARNRRVELVER